MITQVYWIRAKHHTDVTSDGYIGVSKNANKRWAYGHKWAHAKGRHDNPHLSSAISKHGWDNLVKTILVVADESYCYDLERKLRPEDNIGWNLVTGGGKPPVSKSRGVDYISPLKGVPRPTPWLVGKSKTMPENFFSKGGKAGKGRKQTPEQVAKRVASRRATLANISVYTR
tara:strand:- start:529 stop:1044 length:516 start_codon:yes stop_codon:yes gene_type:complete